MNRLSRSILVIAFLAAPCIATAQEVQGDVLLIERVQEKPANLPGRGMSMAQVEARFGAPSERLDPRGGQRDWPTINRWTYPAFTVYFEAQQGHRRRHDQGRPERDRAEAAHHLRESMEESVRSRRVGTPGGDPDRLAERGHRLNERLAGVEETYIALVVITRFQRVVICVADDDVETYAEMRACARTGSTWIACGS